MVNNEKTESLTLNFTKQFRNLWTEYMAEGRSEQDFQRSVEQHLESDLIMGMEAAGVSIGVVETIRVSNN